MENRDKCFMLKTMENGDTFCSGYILKSCPENCKFKKTKREQLAIEKAVYEHILNDEPFLYHDHVSAINPDIVYIYADLYNMNRLQRREHEN